MQKNKPTKVYLKTAGFTIKLVFNHSDGLWKGHLIELINRYWGEKGYLEKKRLEDFKIEFLGGDEKIPMLEKDDKRVYALNFIRDFKNKKFTSYYHISLVTFQIMLKEIINFLLKGKGLILHGSSVLDKNGKLFIFLAPQEGGKSTTADSLKDKGFEKFSDDNLILTKNRTGWIAYSPPFIEKDGLKKSNISDNFKLFRIRKSKDKYLKKIGSNTKKLKIILNQMWLSKETIGEENIELASKLVQHNSLYELKIPKKIRGLEKLIYED